jgi:murein DD-endopeptidase MepM/ murein hydrolase activator NlpD
VRLRSAHRWTAAACLIALATLAMPGAPSAATPTRRVASPRKPSAAAKSSAALRADAIPRALDAAHRRSSSPAPAPGPTESPADQDGGVPVAGAFVYPVGDDFDYTKARAGDGSGFYISDPYLARRGKRKQRVHYGIDLSNGRGGAEVHAIAAGVVVVSEPNALVKVRKKQRVKLPTMVNGKRVYRWGTRYRSTYAWRTGWGNRVVIRHILPSGEVVYSLYAHLKPKSVIVRRGDVVAAGQPIARVGRTGHATSAHLHLEVRKEFTEAQLEEEAVEEAREEASDAAEVPATAKPFEPRDGAGPGVRTVDPMAFLEAHVVRFRDLDPGSWQARYALAACRDGILAGDGDRFEPSASITRGDFYRALVLTFHLGTPFTTRTFESTIDALVDTGILDGDSARRQRAEDSVSRSDALELVLRCMDQRAARGRSLARIEDAVVCRDFNQTFAGSAAAAEADRAARTIAAAEYATRQKEAREAAAAAAKRAKATGRRTRSKLAVVKPVEPVPRLDPGFESLAQSEKNLSRAEACLLLASALRAQPNRLSALERAASRTANSG